MKNRYIFFRTDRIGDFLLSAILIKSIKRSDINSYITVVASKKNHYYINNFDFIDEVILYPDFFLDKILFYLSFFLKKFHLIAVLDGKKRSLYFTLLTRSKFKFLFTYKKFYKIFFKIFFTRIYYDNDSISKIAEIKAMLNVLKFNFNIEDLNTIDKSLVLLRNLDIPLSKKYTLLHLDEKWIFKDYIQSYKSIEPESEQSLLKFIEQLVLKTNNDVFISTGILPNRFTYFLKNRFIKKPNNFYELNIYDKKIILFDNLNFLSLEKLILLSNLFISCHGAATHIAASFNIETIDIIDKSEEVFFNKWTSHFRKYHQLDRADFSKLTFNIIELI